MHVKAERFRLVGAFDFESSLVVWVVNTELEEFFDSSFRHIFLSGNSDYLHKKYIHNNVLLKEKLINKTNDHSGQIQLKTEKYKN